MTSRLVLYYSLPFHPVGQPNHHLSGHAALGIDGTVYQLFDPRLLKADFLVSAMPEDEWLFGEAGFWVGRDPASPNYRHVYLYGLGEARRTVVYAAEFAVAPDQARAARAVFEALEDEFHRGLRRFGLGGLNCAWAAASALEAAGVSRRRFIDRVPALLFRRLARRADVVVRWDQADPRFQLQWVSALMDPYRGGPGWVSRALTSTAPSWAPGMSATRATASSSEAASSTK